MPGMHAHQRCCDLASNEVARLATVVDGADPATPVPTCGRWTLADLIQHIGQVHRWAAAMVAELSPTRHSRRKADLPLPADPDPRIWAWGPDKHARFWSRRMLHETAVHRADAELSLGIDPVIDPAVAVDGIDEFLENLPRSRPLRGDGEQLHLAATDRPDHWTITRHPTTFTWAHGTADPTTTPAVTANATTADLYLFLWGRRPSTDPRFAVTGDHALLSHWRQHAVIN